MDWVKGSNIHKPQFVASCHPTHLCNQKNRQIPPVETRGITTGLSQVTHLAGPRLHYLRESFSLFFALPQQVHIWDNHIHTCEYMYMLMFECISYIYYNCMHIFNKNIYIYITYISLFSNPSLWTVFPHNKRDQWPQTHEKNSPFLGDDFSPGFAQGTSYIEVGTLEKVLVHKPILP